MLQSICYRADGDACICPNSYRDLYKTQHDCGRKKAKLRRSIVFRLRRMSPPRSRRCRRLASYGLLAFASYGLLALVSYDRRLWTLVLKGLEPQAVPAASPARNPDTGRRLHAWQTATRCTPHPKLSESLCSALSSSFRVSSKGPRCPVGRRGRGRGPQLVTTGAMRPIRRARGFAHGPCRRREPNK